VRLELTHTGFTARRSDRLSYGHHQRAWQESNLRRRELQSRASPLGHMLNNFQRAGQGSNLSLPVLETGVPPLELPTRDDDA
jgi:hypothetical protein